ncbi:MAG: hypothetical protein R2684_12725 [Pyrinomonadaceae bacterium]
MTKEQEYLKWLKYGYYFNAALVGLFSLIPIVHVTIGVIAITGGFDGTKDPPPPFFGWIFVFFGLLFITLGMTLAVANLITARSIGARKNYTMCLVVGGFNLLMAPLGQILGILTFVLLLRDPVKYLFGQEVPDS